MEREDHVVTYTSSANEYYKWIKNHPIKFIEYIYGIKLKWHQKIRLLFIHYKNKRKERKII